MGRLGLDLVGVRAAWSPRLEAGLSLHSTSLALGLPGDPHHVGPQGALLGGGCPTGARGSALSTPFGLVYLCGEGGRHRVAPVR